MTDAAAVTNALTDHAAECQKQRDELRRQLALAEAEGERLRQERDAYASEALQALAGVVCTPERGYVQDGGPGLMGADIRRLQQAFERAHADVQSFRNLARHLKAERDALARFKAWTHAYLDAQGVPHHTPGPHGAEGCRVGDRLDWWRDRLRNAEAERDRLKDDAEMASDCLVMIAVTLSRLGCKHGPETHKATPPMMYPEWIACVIQSRVEPLQTENARLAADLDALRREQEEEDHA